MSDHRRRPNPGGEQPPGGGAAGQRPYAYGTPPEGAASYDRPAGVRETAQQPRLTRAEMRKQAQKGGGRGDTAARSAQSGPPGRGGGRGGGNGGGKGGGKGPGKKRFIDYPRYGKSGIRRWLPSWKLILTTFLIFFGSGVAAVGVAYAMTPVPNPNDLVKEQNNIYYWADGSEMTRKGATNRQVIPLANINESAQKAVVAAENETFWTDKGIDPKGIARAVYKMASGGSTQGGSTITQQYVKNAYLNQDQTLSRKFKEIFITLKINQQKSKEDVLEGYLNTSWFGRGATGIQAAAQAYYGVDAKDLNICQSAMLAGLLKGATYYDPTLSDANAKNMQERWNYVLTRMVATKSITQADRDKCGATFPKPIDKKAPANMNGEVSYLVDLADKYLASKDPSITQASIDKGGYQIYTTFQKDKVAQLKKAVDDVKSETLDSNKRDQDKYVQVGAASVVPGDGAIVAIYGGDGVENGHYTDNADTVGIPVGSTFKPFVLATAMQYGVLTKTGDDGKPVKISIDSRYNGNDMSPIYKADGTPAIGDNGQPYHQKNDDDNMPGAVTLKTAMQYSYNAPFVQLGQDVGGSNVEKMAIALGLRKESLAPNTSLTYPLGTSTPSAIRMASAYSVFAARGQQVDPYSVTKVLYQGVEKPAFNRPKNATKTVLDQPVADNITDVLQNVAENGTGKKGTQGLGRPVAGKTGTTDAGTSAWWVGYTPQLATSVGMWREEPGKPGLLSLVGTAGQSTIHGGDFPTEIFTRYMKVALADQKATDFPTADTTGTEVDSKQAPAPTPSAPPSVAPSSSPTASASSGPSPSSSASSHTPEPPASPGPSESCFLGPLCPSSGPTHSKPPRPGHSSSPPNPSSSPSDGGAGAGMPGN
ncbi:transglycosylase domain-containing protein [Kitasatospora sp. HPMI-4]|uniref:transglycosylase domain-containing protein n=1 Tax=Kitasatospora sp. HPMI-4 TaxID=3448443 RepID=UPI003F1AE14E